MGGFRGVWFLGFRALGFLAFRVQRVEASTGSCECPWPGLRVERPTRRFRVWGLGFGVWGLGFRVQGSGFRV